MKEGTKTFMATPYSYTLEQWTWGKGRRNVFCCCNCKKITVTNGADENHSCSCGVKTRTKALSTENKMYNKTLYCVDVRKDEDKVVVSAASTVPYFNMDVEKLSLTMVYDRVVFNTKTGLVYEFGTTNSKNRQVNKSLKILNAVYSNFGLEIRYILSEQPDILKYIQGLITPIKEKLSYDELKLANRLPQLNVAQLRYLAQSDKEGVRKAFAGIKKSDDATTFMNKWCKNIGVQNTKSVRKTLSKDVGISYALLVTKTAGIKDINNRMSLVKKMNETSSDFSVYSSSFVKDLIKARGEVTATRMLVKNLDTICKDDLPRRSSLFFNFDLDEGYISDSCHMWEQYVRCDMNNYNYLKGNLKEIHDRLAKDIDKVRTQVCKTPFAYSKRDLELEFKTNEYTFSLAKSGMEMIDVGREMGICVGGEFYISRVQSKDILIVLVTDCNGDYKCCIEINKKDMALRQVKAHYNKCATGSLANAVREWVKANVVLDATNCKDYLEMR